MSSSQDLKNYEDSLLKLTKQDLTNLVSSLNLPTTGTKQDLASKIIKITKCKKDNDDRILEILKTVSFLKSEMSLMRKDLISVKTENSELRSLIVDLSSKLMTKSDTLTPIHPTNPHVSNVALENTQMPTPTMTSSAKTTSQMASQPTSPTVVLNDFDHDEFKTVVNRRNKNKTKNNNKPVILCKGPNVLLQPAIKRIRRKTIFVTRVAPGTTTDVIDNHIKSNIDISTALCTKLKTKYETYSSFHISFDEHHLKEITNPDNWPEGILISTFMGKLKDDQIHGSTNSKPSVEKHNETGVITTDAISNNNSKNEVGFSSASPT